MVGSRAVNIGRGLRTLAAAAVVALVAAACVSGGGSNDGGTQPGQRIQPVTPKEPTSPVTVTFQSWVSEAQQMKKLAADFKKLHPNITIKFLNVPADSATQKLTTQVAGANAPDTAFLDASAVQDFAQRRALVNLDGYIAGSKDVKLDDYVPGFKQTAVYQNSMFALPYDGETTGLFYRTDLFQAAGITSPPKTWEELQAAAAKLTDPAKKQYGFILFAPEAQYYWLPFLWQAGGNLLSKDGKTIAFNSPQGVQAAEFYVGLRKYAPRDYLGSNSWDGRVAFATGKVAMYEAGAWFGGEMAQSFPKIKGKWSVAPMPTGPARCATTIAGDSLVVTSQSKNKDAAWLWIEFLSRPDNLKLSTFGTPTATLLPPRQSLPNDPELGRYNPWLKGFAEQMKCAVNETTTNPNWGQVSEALNSELGKAIYGEQTAAEAAARGLPFARPLVLEFPDDPATWRIGDQFLCGRSLLVAPLLEAGGRRRLYLPAGTWTDWWTRERVAGPRFLRAEHGLDTMPLYLREGAVVPMGPVLQRVGERPADPLTVVVAPFEEAGRTELRVPTGGREATVRYRARDGRHRVEVAGHPGALVLDAPPGVELRP